MALKILITGASGFVGSHLLQVLAQHHPQLEIIPTSVKSGSHPVYGAVEALNVSDRDMVAEAIKRHAPTHVIHLAGVAAPTVADANPRDTWNVHLFGALNLAEAILESAPSCWLFHVGSGLVYGNSAKSDNLLDERTVLAPVGDYAASKAAADLALGAMVQRGLKCILFRPFNHSGPGQTDAFIIPALASQIAKIEAGLAPPFIHVGNLEAKRDFLDVRDVVEAYVLALDQCEAIESGAIVNIASGIARSIKTVLNCLLSYSTVKIEILTDQSRMRVNDIPCIAGDAEFAKIKLGWVPKHTFEEMLADVLEDWRKRQV